MNREQQLVHQFHTKYGCTTQNHPALPDAQSLLLRIRLIQEECSELITEASNRDLVGFADALADILFVVYGTAVACGIDMAPVFEEVARSNLTKDGGGKDFGGKIIKGPNYSPPDIKSMLDNQAPSSCTNHTACCLGSLDGHNA